MSFATFHGACIAEVAVQRTDQLPDRREATLEVEPENRLIGRSNRHAQQRQQSQPQLAPASDGDGSTPAKYFSVIAVTRDARLPKPLASSEV